MSRLPPVVLLAAALCAPAAAQHQFLPFGASIGAAAPQMTEVQLGFPFPMPGGVVVDRVDVDRFGRIVEPGAVASTPSYSTTALSNDPTSAIAVFWRSFDYTTDPNAGVFFQTDGATVAVISWVNVTANSHQTCTFQCQLHGDGRIVTVYDSRCPRVDGLVAVSPGRGAALPPESDLGAAIQTPILAGDALVFERFSFSSFAEGHDLASTALEFAPQPAGPTAWTITGNAGVVDRSPPFATHEHDLGGCFERRTFTFTPDGAGGYTVAAVPSRFDPVLGAPSGAIADDEIVATALDLGFDMDFPDGSRHRLVDIDPNGCILPTGTRTIGDTSPSVHDITTNGYPYFFGAWGDWDPSDADSDAIWFKTDPGVSATFTWHRVTTYGDDLPCTWQIRLLQGGAVEITWQDLRSYPPYQNFAVGVTSGQGTDPGPIDFTALGSVAAGPIAYEFWDRNDPFDWQIPNQPQLLAIGRPRQPGSLDLQLRNAGGATFGMYLLGLAPDDQYLLGYGMPCTLRLVPFAVETRLAVGAGDIGALSLTIPPAPDLAGLRIRSQGLCAGAPFATPLFLTNSVLSTIGEL